MIFSHPYLKYFVIGIWSSFFSRVVNVTSCQVFLDSVVNFALQFFLYIEVSMSQFMAIKPDTCF